MARMCDLCGKKTGWRAFHCQDGVICKDCYKIVSNHYTTTVTGKTLAVLSVTAPFFEGNLEVEPEFQEEILEGELLIAGKLTAWKFTALVLELFTDKNIRKTISHIKNFKL